MINGRRRFLHKTLVLVARDAARRFAPGRWNDRSRLNLWRPIVLQWRQRVIRPVHAAAGRAALPARFLSFPQFHFHLATYWGDRTQNRQLAGMLPAAGWQQARVVLNCNWTSAGAAQRALRSWRARRHMRAIDSRTSSWPQSHARAPAASGISWWRTASPIVGRAAHDPRWQVFGQIPEKAGAATLNVIWTQLFSGHLQIRERWLPLFAARVATPGLSIPGHSPESKRFPLQLVFPERPARGSGLKSPTVMAEPGRGPGRSKSLQEPQHSHVSKCLQVRIDRVEELVWRRGLRSPTAAEESGSERERPPSHHGPAVRSIPSREAVQAQPPAAVQAAALQAAKLDPGLLDRLTDDVIRRVEQRIRIERQRRGL